MKEKRNKNATEEFSFSYYTSFLSKWKSCTAESWTDSLGHLGIDLWRNDVLDSSICPPVVQSTPYPFWVLLMLPILLDIKASAGQTIGMVWKHHTPRLALRHLQYPLIPHVRVPVGVPSAPFLIKLPANTAWKAAEEGPSVFFPWHTCGRSSWNSRINPSSYSHLESESAHGSLPFLSATLAIQINKS